MIYLFSGSDQNTLRAHADTLIKSLRERQRDASYFRIVSDEFDEAFLEELIAGQGLFAPKALVFLDLLSRDKDTFDVVVNSVDEIADSENVFVILEQPLSQKHEEKLASGATKHIKLNLKEAGTKEVNVFQLTDALGRRDKKQGWVLFHEALTNGKAPEEIHGAVTWFVRSVLASSTAASASEAGLKPFVFTKSKKAAQNFSHEELRELSRWCATMSETERHGGSTLAEELERMILSL